MLDLLPVTLRPELPDLYSQEHECDPMVVARFHTAKDEYQWLVTEFSHEDQDTCFGYVVGPDGCEWGYFSLTFLQMADLPLEQWSLNDEILYQSEETVPPVLRDKAFTPARWSVCQRMFELLPQGISEEREVQL